MNFVEKAAPRLKGIVIIILLLIGIFLRLYFFGINRALDFDEALLGLNLVNRSWIELIQPLDFQQAAPIGFLLSVKAIISVLPVREYTLRLIPLVSGCASLALFYYVAKRFLQGTALLISFALFSFSAGLINYSAILKQYSSDVLVTLILVLLCLRYLEGNTGFMNGLLLLGAGAIAIWFSHPSVFILGSILLTLFVYSIFIYKDWKIFYWCLGMGLIWGLSLLANYLISLRYIAANNFFTTYWNDWFAPPQFWKHFDWYFQTFLRMMNDPAGLTMNILPIGLMLIGMVSLSRRSFPAAVLVITPFILTLSATMLHKYPFFGRLILFLLPFLFILLAEGIDYLRRIVGTKNNAIALLIFTLFSGYLLYEPVLKAYRNVQDPPMGENIRPSLYYIRERIKDSDIIYVYSGAKPAFDFYAPFYKLNQYQVVYGIWSRKEPSKYFDDIKKLTGHPRVWFIFVHIYQNEETIYLDYLNQIGIQKKSLQFEGSSLYLYDLTGTP